MDSPAASELSASAVLAASEVAHGAASSHADATSSAPTTSASQSSQARRLPGAVRRNARRSTAPMQPALSLAPRRVTAPIATASSPCNAVSRAHLTRVPASTAGQVCTSEHRSSTCAQAIAQLPYQLSSTGGAHAEPRPANRGTLASGESWHGRGRGLASARTRSSHLDVREISSLAGSDHGDEACGSERGGMSYMGSAVYHYGASCTAIAAPIAAASDRSTVRSEGDNGDKQEPGAFSLLIARSPDQKSGIMRKPWMLLCL
jgi:hypothetical protein